MDALLKKAEGLGDSMMKAADAIEEKCLLRPTHFLAFLALSLSISRISLTLLSLFSIGVNRPPHLTPDPGA